MTESRDCIRRLINSIEENYSVSDWKHNGYCIWPVLRVRLYLQLTSFFDDTYESFSKKDKNTRNFLREVICLLNNWYKYWKASYQGVDKIYNGSPSYRMQYRGFSYNKFFDPLMDFYGLDENDLMIEYKYQKQENIYKSQRVVELNDLSKVYRRLYKIGSLNTVPQDEIRTIDCFLKKSDLTIPNLKLILKKEVEKVDTFLFLYLRILKKIIPNQVIGLCYYSPAMLGMNIAAHQLGIPSVDMQHGPQGKYHMAYGSWTSIPENGYEALPNEFYTWDEQSAQEINSWAKETNKHSAKVTGNPWVEGWKEGKFKTSDFEWPEKIVLYTLQPVDELLESYIIETIKKTRNSYQWWLRMHPRQLDESKKLKELLAKHQLLEYVNIEDATTLPLPEILKNCSLHITKFSGCAIEAYQFNKPSVIIDERGVKIMKDYFDEKKLMTSYLEKNENGLINHIRKIIR